jgi:Flp pilus assembly pilin Flp
VIRIAANSEALAMTSVMTFGRADKGAIAVEFGLIFPLVVIMLLGVVEAAAAISANLSVQGAARTGAHFGLVKPPVQGDVSPIVNATKAALPSGWVGTGVQNPAQISASVTCECELTGAIACGVPCPAGEQTLSYLKVDVAKVYTPIVALRYFAPTFEFKNSSQVRLK